MYFHIMLQTLHMQNNFEHMCFWTPYILRAHKILQLTFKVAFLGVSLGSFTLDSDQFKVYF